MSLQREEECQQLLLLRHCTRLQKLYVRYHHSSAPPLGMHDLMVQVVCNNAASLEGFRVGGLQMTSSMLDALAACPLKSFADDPCAHASSFRSTDWVGYRGALIGLLQSKPSLVRLDVGAKFAGVLCRAPEVWDRIGRLELSAEREQNINQVALRILLRLIPSMTRLRSLLFDREFWWVPRDGEPPLLVVPASLTELSLGWLQLKLQPAERALSLTSLNTLGFRHQDTFHYADLFAACPLLSVLHANDLDEAESRSVATHCTALRVLTLSCMQPLTVAPVFLELASLKLRRLTELSIELTGPLQHPARVAEILAANPQLEYCRIEKDRRGRYDDAKRKECSFAVDEPQGLQVGCTRLPGLEDLWLDFGDDSLQRLRLPSLTDFVLNGPHARVSRLDLLCDSAALTRLSLDIQPLLDDDALVPALCLSRLELIDVQRCSGVTGKSLKTLEQRGGKRLKWLKIHHCGLARGDIVLEPLRALLLSLPLLHDVELVGKRLAGFGLVCAELLMGFGFGERKRDEFRFGVCEDRRELCQCCLPCDEELDNKDPEWAVKAADVEIGGLLWDA